MIRADTALEVIACGFGREAAGVSVSAVAAFLDDLVSRRKLPIATSEGGKPSALSSFGPEPTFLVAKTGVGKTLAIPVLELLHACASGPKETHGERKVFVVEPRIPICTDQQRFMASEFSEFCRRNGTPRAALFGAVTSASGAVERDAPIQFITTGVVESMAASNSLDPDRHRVLVDEAHVTVSQNPGVEIAIAKMRAMGVPVSYMSATVDATGLEDELGVKVVSAGVVRYPVLLRHFEGPISRANEVESARAITRLVKRLLVDHDPTAIPAVPGTGIEGTRNLQAVRGILTEGARDRAMGILFVINSFQSERADAEFVGRIVRDAPFNRDMRRVEVLTLASPTVRDAHANAAFRRHLADIEARKGRYVLVATNVVEMGLTFESIDVVVTLDSELRTTPTAHGPMLRKLPLPVNSLHQRAGRAGRLRPGVCFVVNDVDAPYSHASARELDRGLPYGPLEYPLEQGDATGLASASLRDGANDLREWLTRLPLPSRLRQGAAWLDKTLPALELGRRNLADLGMATRRGLTPRGQLAVRALYEVSDVRLAAAILDALEDGSPDVTAGLAVVAMAPDASIDDWLTVPPRKDWMTSPKVRQVMEVPCEPDEFRRAMRAIGTSSRAPTCRRALAAEGLPPRIVDRLAHLLSAGWRLAPPRPGQDDYIELDRSPIDLSTSSESVALYQVATWVDTRFGALLSLPELAHTDQQSIRRRADDECRGLGIAFSAVHRTTAAARRLLNRLAKQTARHEIAVPDGEPLPTLQRTDQLVFRLQERGFLVRQALRADRGQLRGRINSAGVKFDVQLGLASTCLCFPRSPIDEGEILAHAVVKAAKNGLVGSLAHSAVLP